MKKLKPDHIKFGITMRFETFSIKIIGDKIKNISHDV